MYSVQLESMYQAPKIRKNLQIPLCSALHTQQYVQRVMGLRGRVPVPKCGGGLPETANHDFPPEVAHWRNRKIGFGSSFRLHTVLPWGENPVMSQEVHDVTDQQICFGAAFPLLWVLCFVLGDPNIHVPLKNYFPPCDKLLPPQAEKIPANLLYSGDVEEGDDFLLRVILE